MSVYSSGYVGRFAPSPTGELHFGSLVAAVASFADARHHGGDWILRIDDIDTPRVVDGSADAIIHTLARFGFEWAGAIRWQSQRVSTYQQKISDLIDQDLAYPCRCSRRDIELISETGREGYLSRHVPELERRRLWTEGYSTADRFLRCSFRGSSLRRSKAKCRKRSRGLRDPSSRYLDGLSACCRGG